MFRVFRAGAIALTATMMVAAAAGGAVADEPGATAPVTLADELAAAAGDGAAGAAELAEAVGLPADGPNSLNVDADGNVAVTVTFDHAPTPGDVAAVAAIARVDRVYTFSPAVLVSSDPRDLPAIAALPGVTSVAPVLDGITGAAAGRGPVAAAPAPIDECRPFPVDADIPQRSGEARDLFAVDGTGITIGIISDSFDADPDAPTTPEEDVAMGALPGPGNPCGYETPVEVLSDTDSGSDEGRGMAQLVHGVAPGARILFATGWGGPDGMAEAIIALADAGADIIVDDLGYSSETYYQQNLISRAITEVRTRGIAYYSSSGNGNAVGRAGGPSEGKPIGAWQTSAYRAMECPDWVSVPESVTEFDCLDFDPGSGEDATDTIGLSGDRTPQFLLSWAEPIGGIASSFGLQLYTDDATPQLVGQSTLQNAVVPNELLSFASTPPAGDYELVVVRDLTGRDAQEPALWVGVFSGWSAVTWREHDLSDGDDVVGPVTYGHPADGSAIGVGAADWATPTLPEVFSSPGPGRILFEPYDPFSPNPSPAYPDPIRVPAPVVTGVDASQTSFFGELEGGVYRFYGTSAAAPNVAAVHALALHYAPAVSAASIVDLVVSTAAPMTNPYAGILPDEDVYGAGLVDALGLLGALPTRPVSGLVATVTSSTSVTVEWDALPESHGYLVELHLGEDVFDSVTLDAGETAVLFSGLTEGETYWARVAALNASDEPGRWAESSDIVMPPPPHPAVAPAAPDPDALQPGDQGGLEATPSTVAAGGSLTVTGLPERSWVYGFAYSDPVSLGWAWTGSSGAATFTIPSDLPAGTHRLAVTDEDGELLGWITLTVTSSGAVVLPQTGPDRPAGTVSLALAAFLLGSVLVLAANPRRRSAQR